MKASFLKITPIMLIAALANVEVLADQIESRVSKLESQMSQVRTETAHGTYTALTAPGRPQNDGSGVFITGDFLYWKLYEGSAYYAYSDSATTEPDVIGGSDITTIARAHKKSLDFDWDPGFRVAVGFKMAHDNWDMYLNYTQFLTRGSNTKNQAAPFPASSVSTPSLLDASNNSIYSRREIDLYSADLELGRSYFISQQLSIRPMAALQATWMYQKLSQTDVTILNFLSGSTPSSTTVTTELKGRNDFWGIGPKAGVDLNWFVVDALSIYSSASAAVLWGTFDVTQNQSLLLRGSGGAINETQHLKAGPHRFAPVTQFSVGFAYTALFGADKFAFSAKVGYENQYWWRQNYLNGQGSTSLIGGSPTEVDVPLEVLPISNQLTSADDLGFHGLVVELRLDY